MAQIRLNNRIRDELYTYACTLVKFPEQQAIADAAYEKAEAAVRAELVKLEPPVEDIVVLEKYKLLERWDRVYICGENGMQRHFHFKDDCQDAPYVMPNEDRYQYNRPAILVSNETMAAVEDYHHENEKVHELPKQLRNDYRHLIDSARTFEELEEFWPEVSVMRGNYEQRVAKNAVSCLSAEALQRLKDNIASRATD